MEGKRLNLYDPLPSIRRMPSMKIEYSENNKKTTKTITRPELRACLKTEQESQNFDHLTEPASVPFVWEQIPGKPKDEMATLIQQSDLLESESESESEEDQDLDTVSSSNQVSFTVSTSGVSEIDEKKSNGGDDVSSRECLDLMMSRFLPAAKAMAFTHQKSSSYNSSEQKKQQALQNREALVIRQKSQEQEQEHLAIVQSLYDDLNIDEDDDEDDEDDGVEGERRIYPEIVVKKKKVGGFLPKLCSKSSFKILNPVPINRVMNISSGEQQQQQQQQTGLPDWSTRRLSGFISPCRTSCSDYSGSKPESFKRLIISKSQELYPTLKRRDNLLPNYSNSGEIKTFRSSVSTPSRNHRIHDSRFLVEEVIRRRNDRSGNLLKSSPEYTMALAICPPPLPETPSRPWLRRTLLQPESPRPYGVVLAAKKLNQEVLEIESTKWETIVKTSYVHNDHVRYSQELIVHPSRQNNT